MVRAAVDWRRAGLSRQLPLVELVSLLPLYLAPEPGAARDSSAIQSGLDWATDRINETVALLTPHYEATPAGAAPENTTYEVFDYLVDVLDTRAFIDIPDGMWQRIGQIAGAQAAEVARAAGRHFFGREGILAAIIQWLMRPVDPYSSQVLVLVGQRGSGKTSLINALTELARPPRSESVQTGSGLPRFVFPAPILVVHGYMFHSFLDALDELAWQMGVLLAKNPIEEDALQAIAQS